MKKFTALLFLLLLSFCLSAQEAVEEDSPGEDAPKEEIKINLGKVYSAHTYKSLSSEGANSFVFVLEKEPFRWISRRFTLRPFKPEQKVLQETRRRKSMTFTTPPAEPFTPDDINLKFRTTGEVRQRDGRFNQTTGIQPVVTSIVLQGSIIEEIDMPKGGLSLEFTARAVQQSDNGVFSNPSVNLLAGRALYEHELKGDKVFVSKVVFMELDKNPFLAGEAGLKGGPWYAVIGAQSLLSDTYKTERDALSFKQTDPVARGYLKLGYKKKWQWELQTFRDFKYYTGDRFTELPQILVTGRGSLSPVKKQKKPARPDLP